LSESPTKNQKAVAPSLLKSSLVVGVFTMLSRVMGLARDVIMAIVLGAGAQADCFFIAFRIPNFLRRLFAEGAFSQAFVPVLAEYKAQRKEAEVKALVDRVAGALGGILLIVAGISILAAPLLVTVFAPGFWNDPDKRLLTTDLIRITFPYIFFISLAGLAGSILNAYNRFAIPAITPIILNVCLITAALVAQRWFGDTAHILAWGVFIAGAAQLLFQLPFLRPLRMLPRPRWDWKDSGVRRILRLMGPAIFGVSVSQINLLLDSVIASFLPTGSISWLYYSDRLIELPLGIFGIAIATVILPNLSRHQATADLNAFSHTLNWAVRMVLMVAMPATLALVILATPILTTLFMYGEKVQVRDIMMSSISMQALSLGLFSFMLIKVLAPGYYARQDTKTPVKIGIIAMVSNMFLNLLFVLPLHFYWQIGHAGLALATAVSAMLNAGLLFKGLYKDGTFHAEQGWGRYLLQITAASVAMLAVLWHFNPSTDQWYQWSLLERGIHLSMLCAGGFACYAAILWLGGIRMKDLRGV
jgi:putative peptidoglycan lipid II flippase